MCGMGATRWDLTPVDQHDFFLDEGPSVLQRSRRCAPTRSRVVKESSDSGVELKQAAESVATANGPALGT